MVLQLTQLTPAVLGYCMLGLLGLLLLFGIVSVLHKNKKFQFIISTVILLLIAVLSSYLLSLNQLVNVMGLFVIYPFSMLFTLIFSIALVLVNTLSYRYSKDFLSFSMLLGFVAFGAFAVAMADSLVTIMLGIELVSLPTAFMIMINGKQYVESAVKLFVLAAIGVAMLVFGITLLFPYDPSLVLGALLPNAGISGDYLVLFATVLVIAGIAFDASLFPFNLWVPDVYTGSPANITSLLAGINKKVAFVALFEILFIVLAPLSGVFSLAFQVLAILTMFFGNIVAMVQTNVKRMFAYSSISQAGYIAIGLAVASSYGIEASIFQIVAHVFMIIGAFAIVLWLEEKNIKSIQDYNGLGSRNGFAAIALTIFMLSMIGVPPLIGFVGKFLLFTSAINSGLLFLALIGIINSFISVYYYAKVMQSMYSKRGKSTLTLDWQVAAVIAICLVVVVLVGLYPQPFISISALAGDSLSII